MYVPSWYTPTDISPEQEYVVPIEHGGKHVATEPVSRYTPSPFAPFAPFGPVTPVAPITVTEDPDGPVGPTMLSAKLAVVIMVSKNDAVTAVLADIAVSATDGMPKGYALICCYAKYGPSTVPVSPLSPVGPFDPDEPDCKIQGPAGPVGPGEPDIASEADSTLVANCADVAYWENDPEIVFEGSDPEPCG